MFKLSVDQIKLLMSGTENPGLSLPSKPKRSRSLWEPAPERRLQLCRLTTVALLILLAHYLGVHSVERRHFVGP